MFDYDKLKLPSKLYRYTEAQYAHNSLYNGEFLFRSADYYNKCEGDTARQDNELVKNHTSKSQNNFFIDLRTGQLGKPIAGEFRYESILKNHFISCFSTKWNENLFKAFSTKDIIIDSCLIIHDVEKFISRLCFISEKMFPRWAGKAAPIVYGGDGYVREDIYFYKPIEFSYQNEWRFTCVPPPNQPYDVEQFLITMGNIERFAEIKKLPFR